MRIQVNVNGESREADVEPRLLLVHFIRDTLGLTGTHWGCDTSNCGACTVHLDGEPVKSCTVLAVRADSHEVTTIEGLSPDGSHPVQKAWLAENVPQCGYCQSGQIMAAAALLTPFAENTDEVLVVTPEIEESYCHTASYTCAVAAAMATAVVATPSFTRNASQASASA